MVEIAKKVLKGTRRLWRTIKLKIFILLAYIEAQREYWLGPHGRRSSPRLRLQPIAEAGGTVLAGESRGSPAAASGTSGTPGTPGTPTRIALFIVYAPRLTKSNRAYLEALREAGFAIVYINNARTDPADINTIATICWRCFDRRNIGRDFGGFRDGILLLNEQGYLRDCKLLCIANDSMQFIPGRNARELVNAINDFASSNRQALFSHISHQVQTHYQSYFQILKPEVFLSKPFLDFWKDYRPLSHRGHCIYNGEIALSQKVYRRFTSIQTLYTSDALMEALEEFFRSKGGVPAAELLRLMPSPARTSQVRKVGYSLQQLMLKSDGQELLTGAQLYSIPDLIENGNPTHIAAFLYPFYLQCPFVKHDLCSAGSYTFAQAITLFREVAAQSIGEDHPQEIQELTDEFRDLMYARGVPLSYHNRVREAAVKGITSGFVYPSTYE